ncbi:hypothetical protein EVAR_86235_1 [Eumeta japonica]|uniref:Uncharacterized protein n=1 Tax=Eumeta variegata TaxID=151549 RepID=A0A4C1UBX5_EUMVA|nr:hypothetical protein EVAR_86235_1 [Eumeta japonica]
MKTCRSKQNVIRRQKILSALRTERAEGGRSPPLVYNACGCGHDGDVANRWRSRRTISLTFGLFSELNADSASGKRTFTNRIPCRSTNLRRGRSRAGGRRRPRQPLLGLDVKTQ